MGKSFSSFIILIGIFFAFTPVGFAEDEMEMTPQVSSPETESESISQVNTTDEINTDEDGTQATLLNPQVPNKYYFSLPLSTPFNWGGHFGPRLIGSLKYADALYSRHLKNPGDTKLEIVPSSRTRKSRRGATNLATQFHIGTDFRVPKGTPVNAVYKGSVYAMGYMTCPGYTLAIKHEIPGEKAVYTMYKHLSGLPKNLKVGDQVQAGDVIALSGASGMPMRIRGGKKTGCVSGAHLHFEVRLPRSDSDDFLLSETKESLKKLTSTRLNLMATLTAAVNPADYIEQVDEACFEKKRIEIENAILVKAQFPNAVAPLSAGLCSEISENRFKQRFVQLPDIYQSIMYN